MFLHADSKDSDQTGQMPRLIFAGHTGHFVGFVMPWLNDYSLQNGGATSSTRKSWEKFRAK